ncbi:hypothetical protein [Methylobacterium aquaticum]|uniref:Uncharacterized protein n=1 Tax=Methylobacterium aquaticum TaxID=270351 RepID=A0A0C6FXN1_9HYPH|nr:hypothetical protein [Methylobacterium aquaticum]BAQ50329.1 hypothetical protein Maq22A_3p50395 [Methylobacterium aquaticum]
MDVDHALRRLWADVADGRLSLAQAEAADARLRGPGARVRPKVRDTARRVRMAFSGVLPPEIAGQHQLTVGQMAVLRVVGGLKACTMSVAEIAARAGVSTRLVQVTVALAVRVGLLHRQERRISRWRSDTNVLTVVCRRWLSWLRRGSRREQLPADLGGDLVRPAPVGRGLRPGHHLVENGLKRGVADPEVGRERRQLGHGPLGVDRRHVGHQGPPRGWVQNAAPHEYQGSSLEAALARLGAAMRI